MTQNHTNDFEDTKKAAKILVIDDNTGILFVLEQAFTLKGYRVALLETYSGVEEVEKLAPHLIFLDISLVGKDGRDVSRELKQDVRTKHIPIVILTAYPDAKKLAKEAGADDYMSKPFDLSHLWEMAEKHTRITQEK